MKQTAFILTAAVFALVACSPDQPPEPRQAGQVVVESDQPIDTVHNSSNSLDWDGVYAGTIPAADGPGIDVTITLRPDSTYSLQYHYVDRADGDFTVTGSFTWSKDGSVITLDAKDMPSHYKVGENVLIQLDMEGNPITGMLENDYILKKQQE